MCNRMYPLLHTYLLSPLVIVLLYLCSKDNQGTSISDVLYLILPP